MKTPSSVLMPFAKDTKTGLSVGIDEVSNGLACNCVCISCGMQVKARQGNKQRIAHFAHHKKAETECKISYWVAIRSIAEQILEQAKFISIPCIFGKLFKTTPIQIKSVDRGFSKQHQFNFDLKLNTSIGEIFVYFLTSESSVDGRNRSYRNSLQKYFTDTLILEINLGEIKNNHHQAKAFLKKILIDRVNTKEWITVCDSYVHIHSLLANNIEQTADLESNDVVCDIETEDNNILVSHTSIHSIDPSFDHQNIIQCLGVNTDLWKVKDYKTCEKIVNFYNFMHESTIPYHSRTNEYSVVYKGLNLWMVCYQKDYFYVALLGGQYIIYNLDDKKNLVLIAKSWHLSLIEKALKEFKEQNISDENPF